MLSPSSQQPAGIISNLKGDVFIFYYSSFKFLSCLDDKCLLIHAFGATSLLFVTWRVRSYTGIGLCDCKWGSPSLCLSRRGEHGFVSHYEGPLSESFSNHLACIAPPAPLTSPSSESGRAWPGRPHSPAKSRPGPHWADVPARSHRGLSAFRQAAVPRSSADSAGSSVTFQRKPYVNYVRGL